MKVLDLPFGKFRDKGLPVDNVSNYDSTQEEIVYICDAEQMRFAKLLFATKQGMIKKVRGNGISGGEENHCGNEVSGWGRAALCSGHHG